MEQYNDYELLHLVKEQNEEATRILYQKYRPFVENKAKKYYRYLSQKGYEMSDLIQEAMIGFDEAIKGYKEDNNVLFYTFLNTCMEHKLSTLVRSSNTNKSKVLNSAISLDEPENDLVVNHFVLGNNPEDDMISRENLEELYDKVMHVLTDFEKDVFQLKINHLSYLEIAQILDRKPKDIDNCLSRIKNKIKKITK